MRTLEATVIRSVDEVRTIEPAWSALGNDCDPSSTFQLPEWALTWSEVFGSGRGLAVVHEGSTLRAVLPLVEGADRSTLQFIGMPLNDRNGVLAATGDVGPAWRLTLRALARGKWRRLSFGEAPEADLRACLQAGGDAVSERTGEPSPLVELPRTWDAYVQSLRASTRKRWQRALSRLRTGHQVDFVVLTREQVSADDLACFHARRLDQWSQAGRLRLLTPFERSLEFASFFSAAGAALARRGRLTLTHLLVDRAPVASGLYLLWGETALDYMGTYDRRFARFSPGAVCTLFGIRHFIEQGMRIYDFGRGDEAYKFDFRATHRDLGGVTVAWR